MKMSLCFQYKRRVLLRGDLQTTREISKYSQTVNVITEVLIILNRPIDNSVSSNE